MLIVRLIATCFTQAILGQYGEPEYPKSNIDLNGYPQELPYSVPYYQETILYDQGYSSSSSSGSSVEDYCHEKKVKHAHCPKRLQSDGGRCSAPQTRRFELNDKKYLEVTCRAGDKWTALVTSTGKIITVAKGKLEHVLACSRHDHLSHKWKTYTFSGERIYLKHVFCVRGDIVDHFLEKISTDDRSGECNSCPPINVINHDNGVASKPVTSTYTSLSGKVCLKQTITCTAPGTREKTKFKIDYKGSCDGWTDRTCNTSINIHCDSRGHWLHHLKPVDKLKCVSAGEAETCTEPTSTSTTTTPTTTTTRPDCSGCPYPSTIGDPLSPVFGASQRGCMTFNARCMSRGDTFSQVFVRIDDGTPLTDQKCNANLKITCDTDHKYHISDSEGNWHLVSNIYCNSTTFVGSGCSSG